MTHLRAINWSALLQLTLSKYFMWCELSSTLGKQSSVMEWSYMSSRAEKRAVSFQDRDIKLAV